VSSRLSCRCWLLSHQFHIHRLVVHQVLLTLQYAIKGSGTRLRNANTIAHAGVVYFPGQGPHAGSKANGMYTEGMHGPIQVTLNNHLTNDASASADARQQSNHVSQLFSTVKAKLRVAMSNPLVTAAVAAVATLLVHNKLPVLKGVSCVCFAQ
jgi:hypothetical protein